MRRVFIWGLALVMSFLIYSCDSKNNSDENKDTATIIEQGVGQDDVVLMQLNDSLKNDPSNPGLLTRRALIFLTLNNDANRALHDINKAISVNPDFPKAYFVLADIYYQMGKFEKCKNALKKSLNLNSQDLFTRIRLAEVYMLIGDLYNSMEELKLCLEQDKNNPRIFYLMGYNCKLAGDTVTAIKRFEKAVSLNSDYVDPSFQLGIIFSEQNNPAGEDFLNKAASLAPESAEIVFTRAMYKQKKGLFDEAIKDYEATLILDPKFTEAYFNIGFIELVEKLSYDNAIDMFDKVLENDPSNLDAIYNIGRAYEAKSMFEDAYKYYKNVLKKKPDYQLAIDALNRIKA
ncbi:MAG: tetratricopeptide repeat protein [Bacteroidales bacterium]